MAKRKDFPEKGCPETGGWIWTMLGFFLALLVLLLAVLGRSEATAQTDPYIYTETVAWAPGDRVLDLAVKCRYVPSILVCYSEADWWMHAFPASKADTSGADTDTLAANVPAFHMVPAAGKVYRGPIRWLVDDGVSRADTVWVDCYKLRP